MDKLFDKTDLSELVRAGVSGFTAILVAIFLRGSDVFKFVQDLNIAGAMFLVLVATVFGAVLNELVHWGTTRWLITSLFSRKHSKGVIQESIAIRHRLPFPFSAVVAFLFWIPRRNFDALLMQVQLRLNEKIESTGPLSGLVNFESPFDALTVITTIHGDQLQKQRPILFADLVRIHDRMMLNLTSGLLFWALGWILAVPVILKMVTQLSISTDLVNPVLFILVGLGMKYVARQQWERMLWILCGALDWTETHSGDVGTTVDPKLAGAT